jgi:hypothetical protein
MIVAQITCERAQDQKECKLAELKKTGVKSYYKLINDGCMKCKSCKVKLTSAGWTRSEKGIEHLVNAATTLEAFEDD